MRAEIRHMDSQSDSYKKADADYERQNFLEWKEKMIRNGDIWENRKTKEEIETNEKAKEAEALQNFITMAHENPEWHQNYMFNELEYEYFYYMNKQKYIPSIKNGVPGYWEYRNLKAQDFILRSRERLPNE